MTQPHTVPALLLNACNAFGTEVAFIQHRKFRRIVWTYTELKQKVDSTISFLAEQQLRKGDTVILRTPNSPEWSCIFFACASLGVVVVPLDSNSTPEFIDTIARTTRAKIIFTSHTLSPLTPSPYTPIVYIEDIPFDSLPSAAIASVPTIEPNDTLEIVFSSGSTGEPKGVVLTHANVCSDVYMLSQVAPLSSTHQFLSLVPLSHMLEQTGGLFSPLFWGASIVYPYTIKPKYMVAALQNERITSIVCVPAVLQLLKNSIMRTVEAAHKTTQFSQALSRAERFPVAIRRLLFHRIRTKLGLSLKEFYVGGAPLDVSLELFWTRLGIVPLQGYGLTEASPLITASSLQAHKPRSVGRVLPGISVQVADDGELLLQGPNLTREYFQNEQATANAFANGWFHSGDVGAIDADGYVYIQGRKKNTIISDSGMNIYPEDIEQALREFGGVKEAVVCGIKKDTSTLLVAAVLTDTDTPSPEEIMQRANNHLASHQQIQKLVLWPLADFPRTTTKKILRPEVAAFLIAEEHSPTPISAQQKPVSTDPLTHIISEITGMESAAIAPNANFVTDLHLDSIKRLELVSRIEDELGIEIAETSISQTSTVGDLMQLLQHSEQRSKAIHIASWPRWHIVKPIRAVMQWFLFLAIQSFQTLQGTQGAATNLPRGPFLLVANHESHLDTPTIFRLLPQHIRANLCVAAAKDYFFKNPFTAFWAQLLFNAFPLDRDGNVRESLGHVGSLLNAGHSVLIYPEGTRSQAGQLGEFKKGIGIIAQEMGVPVVPIKISGNFHILPRGATLPTKGTAHITFGKPVHIPADASYIEITKLIQRAVATL